MVSRSVSFALMHDQPSEVFGADAIACSDYASCSVGLQQGWQYYVFGARGAPGRAAAARFPLVVVHAHSRELSLSLSLRGVPGIIYFFFCFYLLYDTAFAATKALATILCTQLDLEYYDDSYAFIARYCRYCVCIYDKNFQTKI